MLQIIKEALGHSINYTLENWEPFHKSIHVLLKYQSFEVLDSSHHNLYLKLCLLAWDVPGGCLISMQKTKGNHEMEGGMEQTSGRLLVRNA